MKLSKYTLIILPILELILFIEIGSFIGSLGVILSIIITMFLGYYLIKQKLRNIGFSIFNMKNIHEVYDQYTSNTFFLLAGMLLIIPGYITDLVGIVLLIPIFRPRLSNYFEFRYGKKSKKTNVIDGEYRDND
tara:strand:+ start:2868 stop:3266 length:399 start_codon:yes stop_codon:yes gene_type:complete